MVTLKSDGLAEVWFNVITKSDNAGKKIVASHYDDVKIFVASLYSYRVHVKVKSEKLVIHTSFTDFFLPSFLKFYMGAFIPSVTWGKTILVKSC